jgi:hypothetical protein
VSADILRLFAALPLPPGDSPAGRFAAQPIPGKVTCSIGKDSAASPVLLIETEATGPRASAAPIVLEHLSVLHNVDCRMQDAGSGASTRRVSVIRCCGDDPVLHEYFLRAITPVIVSLPPRPTREEVVRAVNSLIELFRRASQTARKTVQGLWAELFVILGANDPSALLRCWHAEPEDRFDFAEDGLRLEVKSAAGRLRIHHFSHEQLRPPAGTLAMIASVLMERSAGGRTVNDLIDDIRQRVADPDLLMRLDAVVADTLGNEWRSAHEDRFDWHLAAESVRFLDARIIPSVAAAIPPQVSDIHYRVDLTHLPLDTPNELHQVGGLFGAVVPV